MGEWQEMSSAPLDGTEIQARIPGHGEDNVIAWTGGYMNTEGDECACWVMTRDQEPPESWHDGVCWDVNADEEMSVQPTAWKPLPTPPETTA